jgi:hypothetical protein
MTNRCQCAHPDHVTLDVGSYGPFEDHVPVTTVCLTCKAEWTVDVFLSDLPDCDDNGHPYNHAAQFVAEETSEAA